MKRVSGGLTRLVIYGLVFYCVLGVISAILVGIMFFGGLLNWIVMRANNGQMPVLVRLDWWACRPVIDSEHCLLTPQSQLPFLADRFRFTKKGGIYSIGDIILRIASELLTLYLTFFITIWILTFLLEIF